MNLATSRARATRRMLVIAVIARALAWGAAAVLVATVLLVLVDALVDLSFDARVALRWIALALGLAATPALLWTNRAVFSLERVALWIEEQVPWLRYALVTAMDERHASSRPVLDPLVGEAVWGGRLLARVAKRLTPPLAVVAGVSLLLALLPDGAVARVRAPGAGDALDRPTPATVDVDDLLRPLVASIEPPAYTGQRTRTIDEPISIAAPAGSRVTVRGRGSATSVDARVDSTKLSPRAGDGRWSVVFMLGARPAALHLRAGESSRVVALESRPDSVPVVVLTLPQRDSVMEAASGRLTLAAEARDDYGITRTAFEYIVTSGSGEQFSFRQGILGARNAGGEREVDTRASLALDSLGLGPGDVVHIRAVARDANAIDGPSTGVSETRSLRMLRLGEHDSIAVEGAPPPEPDRAALSQRMLILLTEALEARRSTLGRSEVVTESRALARDQARLRRLVGEIIFMRVGDDAGGEHSHGPGDGHDHSDEELERLFRPESLLAAADRATGRNATEALDFAHGESPVVAINRPLLEAYNHMWDAGRELEVGEPGRALPPMRRALDALQEARAAERYFLRGRPPAIVVDVDRVRLARRESVTPAPRERVNASSADAATRRARRYSLAIERLKSEPQAAIDSLLLLRIDALGEAPELARALGEAIDALQNGRDATPALMRARRAIEGGGAAAEPLGRWGGS